MNIAEAKEYLRRNIPNMTANDYSEFEKKYKIFNLQVKMVC